MCLTLCNPMNCGSPNSSVHEIFQARILEWIAISSYRESSQPRNQNCISFVSWIASGFLTTEHGESQHICSFKHTHVHACTHPHNSNAHLFIQQTLAVYNQDPVKTHLINKSLTGLNKTNDPFLNYPAHLSILLWLLLLHYNLGFPDMSVVKGSTC